VLIKRRDAIGGHISPRSIRIVDPRLDPAGS
jgi:hypothetical protein